MLCTLPILHQTGDKSKLLQISYSVYRQPDGLFAPLAENMILRKPQGGKRQQKCTATKIISSIYRRTSVQELNPFATRSNLSH